MKKIAAVLMFFALGMAHAAGPNSDMEILRAKMQADKRLLVAAAMELSEAEAKKFWPIYDAYQADLDKINARIGKMITQYANAYNKGAGKLESADAKNLINENLATDTEELKLRKDAAGKLEKALSAAHAARYLQLENKIRALVRYEAAAAIPLAGIAASEKK